MEVFDTLNTKHGFQFIIIKREDARLTHTGKNCEMQLFNITEILQNKRGIALKTLYPVMNDLNKMYLLLFRL